MEALPKKPADDKPAHKKSATAPHVPHAKASGDVKPHDTVKKPRVVKEHPAKSSALFDTPPQIEQKEDTEPEKPAVKTTHGKSFYAVGRRKTAVSQILLTQGNGTITVNQLPFEGYFRTEDLQLIVTQPFRQLGIEKQFNVKSKIHGGGIHAQAESLRHAISRSLIAHNPESRRTLKKLGFLTRDPRVKERKKPGLKRARRAPQFSKR